MSERVTTEGNPDNVVVSCDDCAQRGPKITYCGPGYYMHVIEEKIKRNPGVGLENICPDFTLKPTD